VLRVVADTNVYISALNFGGVPDQVLALARRGRIAMFVSKPVLEEIEGVLKRKFQWPPSRTRDALAAISEFAEEVQPAERVSVIEKDEPDNRVLGCVCRRGYDHCQWKLAPTRSGFVPANTDFEPKSVP